LLFHKINPFIKRTRSGYAAGQYTCHSPAACPMCPARKRRSP